MLFYLLSSDTKANKAAVSAAVPAALAAAALLLKGDTPTEMIRSIL